MFKTTASYDGGHYMVTIDEEDAYLSIYEANLNCYATALQMICKY